MAKPIQGMIASPSKTHRYLDMVEKQTTVRRKKSSASEVLAASTTATPVADNKFVSKAERRGSPQPVGKPHRITYDCTTAR